MSFKYIFTGSSVIEPSLNALGGTIPSGVYTRTATWSSVTDTAGTRRRVEVKVDWNDSAGRAHTITAYAERIP